MKRNYIIFVVTLATLLGSLVNIFAVQQERDFQLRGYVDASKEANLPFRVARFGVNAELSQYNAGSLDQQLKLMEAAHATWVRQIFPWDEIEPEKGRYNWEKWDEIVDAVGNFSTLRLIAVLMYSPTWARTEQSPDDHTAPPANPNDFANFASEFAKRYGDAIDYYQVWDEPNLTATWGGLEPRPIEYAAILRESYSAIHSADSSATVIAGALAPTIEHGPKNISDILYLRDLYALGIQPYMDAVGAKPYGFSSSPNDRTLNPDTLNFSRIITLREEMVSHGEGHKAIWAMNWGWNSLPKDWTGKPSIWGDVTADQQIEYSLASLNRAEKEWPWLAGMILQHWQPSAEINDPIWGFSLIDQQNQPSRLYQALKELPGDKAAAGSGLFSATTTFARYSGVWTFGSLGADIGWVQDSQVEFDFKGESISLLLRQDDYVAYLYPTIDAKPANATPIDASGNAYIVLTSSSSKPEINLVPVGENLSQETHTLHMVADRGWDRWAIAGYGVNSSNLAQPYDNKLLVAWIAVSISGVSVIVASTQINWSSIHNPLTSLNNRINSTNQLLIGAVTSLALMLGMLLTWGDSTPHIIKRESAQLGLAIATAGVIYLEPGFILTIFAAIVLFIIIFNHIDVGLTLVLFWTPFFLFPVELYIFSFPIAEILILLTTAAWFLHLLRQWGLKRQSYVSQFETAFFSRFVSQLTLLDYGVLLFVLLGIISLTWSDLQSKAITELRVMIVEPALFYFIFRTIPTPRKVILRLVDALLVAGFLVAVIGLWQFLQGQAVITAEAGARRLASVYGSPNNVGLFLGRCIPFALAFVLISVDRNRRILAAISLGVMGIAVILSQSVGAIFIGVPAAIFTVLILAWGKRARFILIGFLVITVIGFLLSLQAPRFARVLDFESGTNFYRIRVWQSAINIIRDHPITGLGLDQFLYAFRGRYILPDAWQEPNLSHPHNIILDFWVRLGIFGVILLGMIQLSFWKYIRRAATLNLAQNPILFAIFIGIIGSMVNLLSHGLIDNSVFVQDLAYVFILLLALALPLLNSRAIDEQPL
jgi:O-antigen ligase